MITHATMTTRRSLQRHSNQCRRWTIAPPSPSCWQPLLAALPLLPSSARLFTWRCALRKARRSRHHHRPSLSTASTSSRLVTPYHDHHHHRRRRLFPCRHGYTMSTPLVMGASLHRTIFWRGVDPTITTHPQRPTHPPHRRRRHARHRPHHRLRHPRHHRRQTRRALHRPHVRRRRLHVHASTVRRHERAVAAARGYALPLLA